MQLRKTIKWSDPLSLARGMPEEENKWALLYSGMDSGFTGRHSMLALRVNDEIKSSSFDQFSNILTHNKERLDNAWFGYLGYGLKNSLEHLPADRPFQINMPDLWMVNYRLILLFDHREKNIQIWSESDEDLQYIPSPIPEEQIILNISELNSNMRKEEYLDKILVIKEAINNGDLYQANLTRKFFGTIAYNKPPIHIFSRLCDISPAPYSAFLRFEDKFIISSSPERFLHIDKDGNVETRPIKGSAPRFEDAKEDEQSKLSLENSEKDRAENLMIVDLSRNDLSRSCVAGSVKTTKLFEVTSYATVHHMTSTIHGKKSRYVSTTDLIKGCFPPGSMTGAPKIKAMELCTYLEKIKRGIYAGSIGWFAGDGSADLSVVIRTLILDGNKFEFQVGGAIVSDSIAEDEWQETMIKAKAIAVTLGIKLQDLEDI